MTDLDTVDRCLVALLQVNGRLSHAELSRRLGIPEPTVRRRLKHLLDDGVMQIVAVPNPHKIGYGIHAIVGLRIQPGKSTDVVRHLKALREVRYVGVTAGAYDIVVEALFRDNDGFREFLTETLGRVDGLVGTETSYVLEVAKRTYKVGLAADIEGESCSADDQAVLRRCLAALQALGEDQQPQ